MRSIRILAVGKIKQSARYLETGIALYQSRLARDFEISWVELPEASASSGRTVHQIQDAETEAILKHFPWTDTVVLLHERGRLMTSDRFSQFLFGGNPPDGGRDVSAANRMMFIIGGAYGVSERLMASCTETISLSPLTFPHQMVRLILIEQLYRAATIARGEPYHK